LITALQAGSAAVEVDAERLRQVLLNLVRNALEAMKAGGQLELKTKLDGGDSAAIEIIDSGPGFPEDAPIFDAFYTTKESGTGLGLAIVHRIVEEHGGSVGFESRPGRTCFSVRLPLVAPGPMTFR
jgi:signal transduction histidine kinase